MSRIIAVTVKPGAKVIAGQDFDRIYIPTGIRFRAEERAVAIYRLHAPGYGEPGAYGNGALYVSLGAWKPKDRPA